MHRSDGAAGNLFSAISGDYHVGPRATILLIGFSGSFLTAIGCLLGGVIAARMNRWRAFLGSGLVMHRHRGDQISAAPRIAPVFVADATFYLILNGLSNAMYSALILEVIGRSRRSAGAQYTWLNNLGNVPLAYKTWLDGQGHRLWGSPGLLAVDGIGNVISIRLLFLLVACSGVAKMTIRTPKVAGAAGP